MGILCGTEYHYPMILLAAIRIGAIAVPLNWRLTAYEMLGIMKDAKAKALFYDEEFSESLFFVREA